jgi:hypothetical protein
LIKIYIVLLFSCSDAEKVKKCVDENMSKCSDTLKWQMMTMEKLNMMVIGEMCKFDMKVKNQADYHHVQLFHGHHLPLQSIRTL